LIETINVFNDTFSNIEKKIENLEDTLEGRIENVLEEKKLQDEIMAFDRENEEEEEVKEERKPTKGKSKKTSGGMKSEVNRNSKPTGKKTTQPPRKTAKKSQYYDNDDDDEVVEEEEDEEEENFDDETESDDDDHDHDDYHSRSRRPPSGSSYGKEVHRYDYHEEEPDELQRGQTQRRIKNSPKDVSRNSRRSQDYQEMNDDDEDLPPLKNKKAVVPKKKHAGDDLPDLKKGRRHDKDDDDQDSEDEDMGGNHHYHNHDRPVASRQQQQQGKPVRRNDPSSSRGQHQHQQQHHHSGGKNKQYDHYDPSTYQHSEHSEQKYRQPYQDETASNHHRSNQQQQNHKMPYQYKQQVFSREFNDSSVSSLHSASRQKQKESKNSPPTDNKTSSQVNNSKVGIAAESSSIHNDHHDQSRQHDNDNIKVSSSPVSSESITISEFEEEEEGGEGEDEEPAHKPHRLDPEPPPIITYQRLKDEEKEIEDDMDRIDEYIQLLNSKSADMESNNPYLKQYISEQEQLQLQNDEENEEASSRKRSSSSHEKGIIEALAEDFDEEGEELNDDDHYNEILSDESSYHQHTAQQFEKMIHDHPAHKSLAKSAEKTNPINDYYSINSQKIVDYSFLNNSNDSTYELPFHSHFVSVPPRSHSPPATTTTTSIVPVVDYEEKEVEEPNINTSGGGFAKFHNLIDKIQSDIQALDLHLIKNQQFEEQYYQHHPHPQGGNMTKVNQSDENQQKKGEEDVVLNLSHLRKEEDTEIPIEALPIVQEMKKESTEKEEKRRLKPEKLISLDKLPTLPEKVPSLSPTSSSSTKSEEECFDSDDEEINNANNGHKYRKEKVDTHDSDSSSVPSPVMMMKGSRGGKKSSAVADALNLKKKQKKEELEKTNTKVSLTDLAHLSMNDLNESLEYYDNEEPELPGITVNPRKEVSLPSKHISNTQQVTQMKSTTTTSSSSSDVAKENENLGDSDDDSASDIDSLDEIYFHSNKDLNEMKQTASLAQQQQEEGVLMGGRTPLASNDEGDNNHDLDLLLEFDYLLNRSSGRKSKSPSHQQGPQRSPSPSTFHVPPSFSLSYHNLKESLPTTNDKGNVSHEQEVTHHLKPLRPIDKNVQKKNKFDLDDFLFDQSRQSIHFQQSLQRGGSGSAHSLKDQTVNQKNHRKEEEESMMLDNDFTNREDDEEEEEEVEDLEDSGHKKKNSVSTSSLQRSSQRQQQKPTPSSISSVERSAFLIDDSYENELNELQDYLQSEKEFPSHLYAKNPVLQEEHQKKILSLQEKKRNHRKKFLASLQDS
jgi:hypothetical protein